MASVSNLVLINGALTASTTGDKKSLGPRGKKFVGYLKATSVNGATTLNAKIQHSPDDVYWFDVVSFTALVGVDGSELKDGTQFTASEMGLLPYVRGLVTLAGATQAATVLMQLWFDDDK